MELLLEAGADVNQYHTLYQRPLYQAVSVGATEIVRLLSHGAEVNHVYHVTGAGTELCRAAECGSVPVAKLLLRHGADVTLGSPLSSATWRRGNNAMADLLLEHGANVNAVNGGHSPLVDTIRQWNTDFIR